MRDMQELSSLLNSYSDFNSMIEDNESTEDGYPQTGESIQHMLARFGIDQSQLELSESNELREKVVKILKKK